MSDTLVTYELKGSVALIGLARPEKRNALSTALMAQLEAASLQANREAKVGIIYGHGAHFSAGLDLSEAMKWLTNGQWKRNHMAPPAFEAIARTQIPFIAALHGAVVGGGLEIACAAHIRVADKSAMFALPEGQRGIFVGGGGSVRIARIIGYPAMADMMLTGRTFTAAEAARMRLVQYLVPAGQALKRAMQLADKITQNTFESNFAISHGLSRIQDLSYSDGLFFEQLLVSTTESDEARQRLSAFLEKRAAPIMPSIKKPPARPRKRSRKG